MKHENDIKYFSAFSGIGGFELGIHQAFASKNKRRRVSQERTKPEREAIRTQQPRCLGYCEIDKYAIQIYRRHFLEHRAYGDITTVATAALPDFDLFVGGFPCQAFSIAGKRGGFDDVRGTLFFEIARILRSKKPRLLLLENVKGLLSHDEGRTFHVIVSTLDELGYDLQWQVLNSKDFCVPQNRERVFIVGHFRGTPRPEVFPFVALGKENSSPGDPAAGINNPSRGYEVRRDRLASCMRAGESGSKNLAYDGASVRRLTPVECERLQGFPDGWTAGVSDTQRYKTLGNSVTVNVIQAICERLLV